jgi:hypothetical protein
MVNTNMFKGQPKTYDRTALVRQALNDNSIIQATVYIDYTQVLGWKYYGKGHKKPPARSPVAIVRGWLEGWELSRQCIRRPYGHYRNYPYWYWVKYPAKLKIIRKTPSGTQEVEPSLNDNGEVVYNGGLLNTLKNNKLVVGVGVAVISGIILKKVIK